MNNALRTIKDYELFIYTLTEQFPVIQRSTLRLIRRGTTLARVEGELYFTKDVWIAIREQIVYHRLPAVIDEYGYEIRQKEKKLYWYDSQPHPNDSTLQSTHPHHKHIPPDMKHNRIPAEGMSFVQPNLPILIHEIQELLNSLS